jgi:hypothetical protein
MKYLLAFLLLFPVFAHADEMDAALDVRNSIMSSLDRIPNTTRCDNVKRTVLSNIANQDRLIQQQLKSDKKNPYFWQQTKAAYNTSNNLLINSKCAIK